MNEQQSTHKTDWFKIAYWTAAALQMVGTVAFFFEVGGANLRGALYAISGAVCLELMILAMNTYGETRVGLFRTMLMFTSLFLILVSGGIQVGDILISDVNSTISGRLLGFYKPAQVVVAATPSFCMAVITMVRFAGDAGDVTREIKRLTDQLTDWNVWQKDNDAKMAAKDIEIAELSAKLDEARSRPSVQQVFAVQQPTQSATQNHSGLSLPELPEPSTMPDTLINGNENALIEQYIREGMKKGEIVKTLMAGYGYIRRTAENEKDYDRQYKRLMPKVARWQVKLTSPST